jgi:hypothetical protein
MNGDMESEAEDTAFLRQVGGDHYSKLEIQPMQYSMANHLDACQHTIIKYITRFRDKGGVLDLEKAKHTIDLLIQFERANAPVKPAKSHGWTLEDEVRRGNACASCED